MEIAPSQPASFGRRRAAQLSLQFFFQQNTICSIKKKQTRGFSGCSLGQGPRILPPQCCLSMKLQHLPKHRAKNIGVRWSAACVKSHRRKRSPSASTFLLSTENCWTRGSWWLWFKARSCTMSSSAVIWEQRTRAQGTIILGEVRKRHELLPCSWTAKIWKTRCWWLSGCAFTVSQNCSQKQTLPYTTSCLTF